MSVMAYERYRTYCLFLIGSRAEQGDFQLLTELSSLLSSPYEEGTLSQHEKWFIRTPLWAQQMPGATFLS